MLSVGALHRPGWWGLQGGPGTIPVILACRKESDKSVLAASSGPGGADPNRDLRGADAMYPKSPPVLQKSLLQNIVLGKAAGPGFPAQPGLGQTRCLLRVINFSRAAASSQGSLGSRPHTSPAASRPSAPTSRPNMAAGRVPPPGAPGWAFLCQNMPKPGAICSHGGCSICSAADLHSRASTAGTTHRAGQPPTSATHNCHWGKQSSHPTVSELPQAPNNKAQLSIQCLPYPYWRACRSLQSPLHQSSLPTPEASQPLFLLPWNMLWFSQVSSLARQFILLILFSWKQRPKEITVDKQINCGNFMPSVQRAFWPSYPRQHRSPTKQEAQKPLCAAWLTQAATQAIPEPFCTEARRYPALLTAAVYSHPPQTGKAALINTWICHFPSSRPGHTQRQVWLCSQLPTTAGWRDSLFLIIPAASLCWSLPPVCSHPQATDGCFAAGTAFNTAYFHTTKQLTVSLSLLTEKGKWVFLIAICRCCS